VYDLAVTTKDDFQCVDIEHQYCWEEEKVVKDRTCVFSVDFDCGKYKLTLSIVVTIWSIASKATLNICRRSVLSRI